MTSCDEGGSRPPERWGATAEHIVSEIKPRRALDFGCDGGWLVRALRDRGVEAFGIDLADGAPGEMLGDAAPHCWRASAAEPIAGRYDLIVCVEALAHLSADDARRAIANICASAGDVVFSAAAD